MCQCGARRRSIVPSGHAKLNVMTGALPSDVSATELMRLLGVTRPRITQLEADGIVTRTGRNQY